MNTERIKLYFGEEEEFITLDVWFEFEPGTVGDLAAPETITVEDYSLINCGLHDLVRYLKHAAKEVAKKVDKTYLKQWETGRPSFIHAEVGVHNFEDDIVNALFELRQERGANWS